MLKNEIILKNPNIHGEIMRLDIIWTISDFKSIEFEWNTLLEKSASHVPFLRNEYLLTWWDILGGGEWVNGDLCGIAPLLFTQNKENK